ncbi:MULTISPECIES: DUF3742 family protein [Pseudomonas]|uniref:DUF3742 family protein n=1 Tax=Pseudomonas TaxID=286 RepID=UPI0005A5011C|nr:MULTISPECIES: DUF3742 family protein [Pseudomonas]
MKEKGRATTAMQFGRWLARRWRGYLRFEEGVLIWLQRLGVPVRISKMLGWIFKAVVIIALLYVAFWVTLFVIFIAAGACCVIYSDSSIDMNQKPPQWRDGLSGFGLYDQTGIRIDPYDPDEMP